MNKTALKNFATNARKELIEKVKAKAFRIGITEESIKKAQFESSDAIYIDGKQLSATERKQREKLISRIKEIGYKQVVEEVAYTWFNRFTALRFMEINNYLPTKVRVLSSSNPISSEPDIIKDALSIDLDVDKELIYNLKLNNMTEELFKYLVIKQCNSLNNVLPFMFEMIDDYKEVLFPDGLLAKESFLREMTDSQLIPESDWEKVEIIGWLYQYYIADEKDRVIQAKKKYAVEEIPFATQLFTPDWIVRYMVQNTLGRYWIESHSEHRDLVENWDFYLESKSSEICFEEQLTPYINKDLKVEEIKCIDPAMGSGHVLVYMFDVLFEIYNKCGYMDREIPKLIIENNLYGLDIDDRAYQLACFSLVMKALQYDKRFLRSVEREGLILNLASIQETKSLDEDVIAYIAGERIGLRFEKTKDFIERFMEAKTLGSIIKVNTYERDFLIKRLEYFCENPANDLFEAEHRKKALLLLPKLIKQADIMNDQYDILVTNPPYIGNRYVPLVLKDYITREYNEGRMDIFSSFMLYGSDKVKKNGLMGFVTPNVWMFISSYEKLRERIINRQSITSLIQLSVSGFSDATVHLATFTMRNNNSQKNGEYIKLSEFNGVENQPLKTLEAIKNPNVTYRYTSTLDKFEKIPGKSIAYWASDSVVDTFHNEKFESFFESESLNLTGDNEKYLRRFWEVNHKNIGKGSKWLFYAKGGGYRKWWGNLVDVVNWSPEAINHYRTDKVARIIPEYLWYKKGITWGFVTSSLPSFRVLPEDATFDIGGASVFFNDYSKYNYYLAILNSKVAEKILEILNPTLNYQMHNIASIPIVEMENLEEKRVIDLSEDCISICKSDWDSFETSFEFKIHPLLKYKGNSNLIKEAYNNWSQYTEEQFLLLQNNEEELNSLVINRYGLQNEFTAEVLPDKVAVRKAEKEREIRSFISYGVGSMFGRYSLDDEGLLFTGGVISPDNYKSFSLDKDNILPILSEAYFEDDIVTRFVDFLRITFGEERLIENLKYIADALESKDGEPAKETIRKYLMNDFFKDHIQTYKKRPIYWLFTSGKQKAFNCLIYMHRYDKSTLSRIRTDYLHELQIRMDAERKSLLAIIEGDGTAKEISNAKKELKSFDLRIEELRAYDEKLHHMADMQIEIDLDDGVAVNYAKFEGLLAPIK